MACGAALGYYEGDEPALGDGERKHPLLRGTTPLIAAVQVAAPRVMRVDCKGLRALVTPLCM